MSPPSAPDGAVTPAFLIAFAEAFNRHDADALMGFMTEDCVFDASAGSDAFGTRYVDPSASRHRGLHEQVRARVTRYVAYVNGEPDGRR